MMDTNAQVTDYATEIQQWRQDMETKLRAPDSWLSLVGLYWLHSGINTVGKSPSSDVVLTDAAVPDYLGTLELVDNQVILRLAVSAPVTVDDKPVIMTALRHDLDQGGPSLVRLGPITFFVIKRGEEYGVRVRDANHPARWAFTGRNWFPVNPAYKVTGTFIPYDQPRTLQIITAAGVVTPTVSPGRVEFMLDNQPLSLAAFLSEEDKIWFVFKDGTSGHTTYGAGRFLYAVKNADQTLSLDFNKAYHPPCAFTAFATCPLAPRENWLPVEIMAGECS